MPPPDVAATAPAATVPAAWRDRRVLARCVPFALFMLMLALRGELPLVWSQWLYPVQAGLAALALAYFWRDYAELRGSLRVADVPFSLAVGVVVFVLWIQLDHPWMSVGSGVAAPPPQHDGMPDWRWIALRIAGAALVVPIMEELFWRSFLMRWLAARNFLACHPAAVSFRHVGLAALVFASAHQLWFAAVLAGLAYALCYRYRGLWSAVIAHATTNLLLGLWVLHTGQWQFW